MIPKIIAPPASAIYGALTSLPFGGISMLSGGLVAGVPVIVGTIGEIAIEKLEKSKFVHPNEAIVLKKIVWVVVAIATLAVASILFTPGFALLATIPTALMLCYSLAKSLHDVHSGKTQRIYGHATL